MTALSGGFLQGWLLCPFVQHRTFRVKRYRSIAYCCSTCETSSPKSNRKMSGSFEWRDFGVLSTPREKKHNLFAVNHTSDRYEYHKRSDIDYALTSDVSFLPWNIDYFEVIVFRLDIVNQNVFHVTPWKHNGNRFRSEQV